MKLIEKILDKSNVRIAFEKVIWMSIKQSILERSYKPASVMRVEIPEPNGGVRKLGINNDLAKLTYYCVTATKGYSEEPA